MAFRVAEAFIQLATRGFDEVIAQIGTLAGQAGDLGGIVPALDFSAPAASASGLGAAVNGVADGMDRLVNSTRLVTQSMGQLAAITGHVGSAAGVAQARLFNYRVEGIAAGAQVAAGFKLTTAELGQVLSRLAAVHPLLGRMGSLINGVSFAVQTLGVSLTVATGGLLAVLAAAVAAGAAMKAAFAKDAGAQRLLESIQEHFETILETIGGPLLDAMEEGLLDPLNRALGLAARLGDAFDALPPKIRDAFSETAGNSVVFSLTGGLGVIFKDLLELLPEEMAEKEKTGDRGGAFVALEEFAKQLQGELGKEPAVQLAEKQLAVQERIEGHLAGGREGGGPAIGPRGVASFAD